MKQLDFGNYNCTGDGYGEVSSCILIAKAFLGLPYDELIEPQLSQFEVFQWELYCPIRYLSV